MLNLQAQKMGFKPQVLCPRGEEPAADTNPQWQKGEPHNAQDLEKFSKKLSLLTFESEFYEPQKLEAGLTQFQGSIFPSLKVLQLLQDRLTQKQSLVDHKLPTSPFVQSTNPKVILQFFNLEKALVAKQRRYGYDGYGTFILKTKSDLEKFLEEKAATLQDFIFEKFIPFQSEMAVQVARSRAGDIQFFPFVTTIQKDNKCFLVVGPEKPNLDLQKKISKWLHKIDYVGVIGVEFFKTSKGLIINEIAPRVHNTGHHTLDSCTVDQFTMHWLCGIQDKLPKVELKSKAFVMLNLLGESDDGVVFPSQIEGSLYWYRKSNRKGRKLGHINFTGSDKKALMKQALKHLKTWKL